VTRPDILADLPLNPQSGVLAWWKGAMKKKKSEPFIIVLANLLRPLSLTFSNLEQIEQINQQIKLTLKDAQRQHPQFRNEWQKLYNEMEDRKKDRVIMYCEILRDMVFQLAYYDDTPSWLGKLNKFLENVSPIVRVTNKGSFVVSGMARSKPDYISELSFEIVKFLIEDYRPGLISTCGLYECKKYIVTWTGQKYCTKAHARKHYDQQRLNEEVKATKIRIENRLNKQWHRKMKATRAAMENKYPRGFSDYKAANWPKDNK